MYGGNESEHAPFGGLDSFNLSLTSAPRYLQSWIAANPMPPVAEWIKTLCSQYVSTLVKIPRYLWLNEYLSFPDVG